MTSLILAFLLAISQIGTIPNSNGSKFSDQGHRAVQSSACQQTVSASYSHKKVGTASYGPFYGHVVTRLKRGTPIKVCSTRTGTKKCWTGRSWGYGPAKWTGRIADLDYSVMKRICGGEPKVYGLCKVTLQW